jgi:AcrR family transcriptional regulator
MLENSPAKARRERQKAELRQAILDAAREIAAQEGWHAVTTRKVADKIEYSLPTLYEYFENKAALLAELNREGYRQLLAALQAARAKSTDVREDAREIALAYCNFAWQHRELYEVMHGLSGVYLEEATYHNEAQALLAEAHAMLSEWAKAEKVKLANIDDSVHVLWATLHGIASLALAKQVPGGKKRAAALARQAVDDMLSAWKANS